MKKRFLLIDSENVQNRLFEIIENSRKKDKIIVFYTVYHSGKLQEYLRNGKDKRNIEFVECIAGNNALDLQLMGVLSYLIQRHPKRAFVVYSNDKGYKALVKHWQSKNVDIELINFLTPAVGEEAYEFKSPITVETTQKKSRGRKSRVGFSSVAKGLSAPKKTTSTAVVEKTVIRKQRTAPEQAENKPETSKKTAPVVQKPQKTEAEPKKEKTEAGSIPQKPAETPKPAKPRAVVDALLISAHPSQEAAQKPKINNTVPAQKQSEKEASVKDESAKEAAKPAEAAATEALNEKPTETEMQPAPVRKKRGRKSKAEKEAEEAAKLAAQQEAERSAEQSEEEKPVKKRTRRSSNKETAQETSADVQETDETSAAAADDNIPEKLSDEDYIREICRSVRSGDLALINRVLSVGFGSDAAKGIYARFKSDHDYREEMSKLYEYAKDDRIRILMETALMRSGLDKSSAAEICRIIKEKGTGNMQALYHSFIKQMPGNVAERQSIYKAVKPYLGIIDNL